MKKRLYLATFLFCFAAGVCFSETLFLDANTFEVSGNGWLPNHTGYIARQATWMRSAAMKHHQVLGHYLIGYAGRSSWTMKTYTASHVARDNKILNAYWSAHEAGPPWNNHPIQARTDMWYSLAEIVREIGAAEDLLYPAKKRRSQVAIIYSSSADIWEMGYNYAFGFERMHTWLVLTHKQIPVDFLSEKMIEEGWLNNYKVAYFSGTAITEKAAEQMKLWVLKGGVLVLTAGAGMKDQFNRPLKSLDSILPAERSSIIEIARYLNSGRYLDSLSVADTVIVKETGAVFDVLAVKQTLKPKPGSVISGTFSDSSPSIVSGKAGRGTILCCGFLPAIAYMRKALIARNQLMKDAGDLEKVQEPLPSEVATDIQLIKRAFEPWQYPEEYRNLISMPMYQTECALPVKCSTALVDAIVMDTEKGSVVVLSNYTFQPITELTLDVKPLRRVTKVESVRCGSIRFTQHSDHIRFSLPLRETDFVKIYYR